MSELKVNGFKASDILSDLGSVFAGYSDEERSNQIRKTNGIFELQVTNEAKEQAIWTIDMKKSGTVYKGEAKPRADVTIILADDVFVELATAKLNGQKAFMTGKLKTKGNMMLATKLDNLLQSTKTSAKL